MSEPVRRRRRLVLNATLRVVSKLFRVQILWTDDDRAFEEILRFLEDRRPQRDYSWRKA